MCSYITEMPLWSGVLLGSPERFKKTGNIKVQEKNPKSDETFLSYKSANAKSEGYIEGVMRQLKQEDFPGKKRIRADAFALENYEQIRRRLNDFGDRIHTALNPKPNQQYRKRKLNVEVSSYSKDKRKKMEIIIQLKKCGGKGIHPLPKQILNLDNLSNLQRSHSVIPQL